MYLHAKEQEEGYDHIVVFTSCPDLDMSGPVEHYDGQAGMETISRVINMARG